MANNSQLIDSLRVLSNTLNNIAPVFQNLPNQINDLKKNLNQEDLAKFESELKNFNIDEIKSKIVETSDLFANIKDKL